MNLTTILLALGFGIYLALADYYVSTLRPRLGFQKGRLVWAALTVLPILVSIPLLGWFTVLAVGASMVLELGYLAIRRWRQNVANQNALDYY